MERAEIHGISLEVKHIRGSLDRAPLVFLHEGLGSVAMWTQRERCWPRELCSATGRSGWLYSRRGYGRSDPVNDVRGEPRTQGFWHVGRHDPDYMHREAFDVLPELLVQLGISQPVLVGHSDGATIALLHSGRHPVAACIAIAPHVMVEAVSLRSITRAREAYLNAVGEHGLRQRLSRHHRDVDNAFWQWNDAWLSPAFGAFDIREDCRRITAPLLAVQGLDDEYGSVAQLHEIVRHAPHARAVTIAACGHSPHRDQPDALTTELAGFLDGIA